MRQELHRGEPRTPRVHFHRDVPNFPEVFGTSFPVLTTVLAGFAVTITVQLLQHPGGADDLPGRGIVALGAFLLATLALLLATAFAINAQARNYLTFIDLNDVGRRLLHVDDIDEWILGIERQWRTYHRATISAFYSGLVLLLAGINLVVWLFVGPLLAIVFLAAIILSLAIGIAVALVVERRVTRPSRP